MVVFLRGANIYLSLSWLHNKIKRPHHCLLPKQLFVTNICLYLPQQIILTNIEMLTDSNIKQFFSVFPLCVCCANIAGHRHIINSYPHISGIPVPRIHKKLKKAKTKVCWIFFIQWWPLWNLSDVCGLQQSYIGLYWSRKASFGLWWSP